MTTVATSKRSAVLNYFSLFTSLSTLLCCALPSLLVLFGLGASVASMLSFMPWLVTLSRHKQWTFAVSGVLIAVSFGRRGAAQTTRQRVTKRVDSAEFSSGPRLLSMRSVSSSPMCSGQSCRGWTAHKS